MKYLINENQYGNLKKRLQKSIDDHGLIETLERYKLPLNIFDKIFEGDYEYDCDIMNDLTLYFFEKGLLKKEHNFDGMRYVITLDRDFGGVIQFHFNDRYSEVSLIGYATPYFDADCNLPIDYDYYITPQEEMEVSGTSSHNLKLEPKKTLSELLRWLNETYPKILLKIFIKDLEYFKNNY